jgi:hypothetical protein
MIRHTTHRFFDLSDSEIAIEHLLHTRGLFWKSEWRELRDCSAHKGIEVCEVLVSRRRGGRNAAVPVQSEYMFPCKPRSCCELICERLYVIRCLVG